MLGHQGGFNKISNAYIYQSWKKYISRCNAHALSTILHNLVLFTLAMVIAFYNFYIIDKNNINVTINGRIILKITLYIMSARELDSADSGQYLVLDIL